VVDRCALFVDAGYVLADGAMAVHGTRHRESVSWNYPALLQFLGMVARDRSGLPLLRCYWYEATVEGRRSPEHEALADIPGVKLRLGRMRPGHREGVESEIHRDLITLARNGAVRDAVVVSAEEELAQVIAEVQDMGVRVTLAHITVDGEWTISRALRQECDDIVDIGEAHLRPYVDFVVGAEPAREDERHPVSSYPGHALTNGHGQVSQLGHQQALPVGAQPATEIYTAPVIAEYQRSAQPVPNGQPGPLPSPAHSGPIGGLVSGPVPQPMTALPGQHPGQDAALTAPAGPQAGVVRGPGPGAGFAPRGQPGGAPAGAMGQPGMPQPGPGGQPGLPPGQPGYPAGYAGRGPGGPAGPGAHGGPVGPVGPGGPAAQSGPAGPGGSGPAPAPVAGRALPGGQQVAAGGQAYPPTAPTGRFTRGPQDPQAAQQLPGPPAGQPEHGPGYLPQQGGYAGAHQVPSPPLVPPAVSLADAVQAAHGEGFTFGQAVAREAPQLWLEAVLARKPRMPSDLEAKLLQDSALPIDSLLHDEVRHALRRGFWDALERAR
jgi:hypothetical protein